MKHAGAGAFAIRGAISPRLFAILTGASFLGAALAYAALSGSGLFHAHFLPGGAELLDALGKTFQGPEIWTDLGYSFFRVTLGFLLAAAFAVPLGILVGSFRIAEAALQPITEFARYVPVPALIPLLMVFLGIGESPKVMLIFIGVFFQLLLMTADEMRRVPNEFIQVSYTLGANRTEAVLLVMLRQALPGVFDALRLCNGWAWTYLVVAELIAASEGLGYRILRFYRYKQMPEMYIYLLLLGALGLLLDYLFRRFNQRVFHWADQGAKR